jgi:hypothetical protein
MIYRLPALTDEHEFVDLVFLARYVDDLVSQTGNQDFAVVYEWNDTDDQGQFIDLVEGAPPDAVLLRIAGAWVRRRCVATPRGDGDFVLTFE